MISFTDERPEGSGAKLESESRSHGEGDFTICLDKYITSINGYTNLVFSDDFTLAIPNALDRLVLQFKGIWYYAFNVPNIEPFTWGTVCFSYTFKTHKIRLAYRGKIYLSKIDPELLGKRGLGENFLNNFI